MGARRATTDDDQGAKPSALDTAGEGRRMEGGALAGDGEGGARSFWRAGGGALPGRPSPRAPMAASSFRDFQESVRDAWELDDDAAARPQRAQASADISPVVSLSAAWSVLESHRRGAAGSGSARPPRRSGPPGRPQAVRSPPQDTYESKLQKFRHLYDTELLNMTELKKLSWSGVPVKIRAVTWRLLSGYLPANAERRQEVLDRKRQDYWQLVRQYYEAERDDETYRQIHIDIPRMSPLVSLFQQTTVQTMFERILYIWAIRHPASGYVQGINDLVTPFFMVFLQEVVPLGEDLDNWKVDSLSEQQRKIIEADSFWCLSKFLDSIQDNYIFAQLGIQHKVNQLKELITRIDLPLHRHLQSHGVDYLQFSFRWMNNLLTRELPLSCTIRLWDTYLAESDGFATFQLYVCAAFLLHWRDRLMQEKDFQGLMILLQNVPTHNWQDSHIELLVAEAFRLRFAFADAPNHLNSQTNVQSQSAASR